MASSSKLLITPIKFSSNSVPRRSAFGDSFATVPGCVAARCKILYDEYKIEENHADCILGFKGTLNPEDREKVISLLESALRKRRECMMLCPAMNDDGHKQWFKNIIRVLGAVRNHERCDGLFDNDYHPQRDNHRHATYPGVNHVCGFKSLCGPIDRRI